MADYNMGTSVGDVLNFGYTGSVKSILIKADGIYRLVAWGAQGGHGYGIVNRYGGQGGGARGEIELKSGQVIYVCVGGQGESGRVYNNPGTKAGGYNGGGQSSVASNQAGGGGGGATHFSDRDGDIGYAWGGAYVIGAGGGGGGTDNSLVEAGHPDWLPTSYAGGNWSQGYNYGLTNGYGQNKPTGGEGGGGGAGYYGGGGGRNAYGGSNFVRSTMSNTSTQTGGNGGNGSASITLIETMGSNIYIGNTKISALYLGDAQISNIYIGNIKI